VAGGSLREVGIVGQGAHGLVILLVGAVAVDGCDAQVVRTGFLALAEQFVVLQQRGDAADGEERAVFAVVGLAVVVVDDVVHHLAQALLIIEHLGAVDVLHLDVQLHAVFLGVAAHVLHAEAQHVLVADGVGDHILVQAGHRTSCLVVRLPSSFLLALSAKMGVPVKPKS
jgi:hypothetical protein